MAGTRRREGCWRRRILSVVVGSFFGGRTRTSTKLEVRVLCRYGGQNQTLLGDLLTQKFYWVCAAGLWVCGSDVQVCGFVQVGMQVGYGFVEVYGFVCTSSSLGGLFSYLSKEQILSGFAPNQMFLILPPSYWDHFRQNRTLLVDLTQRLQHGQPNSNPGQRDPKNGTRADVRRSRMLLDLAEVLGVNCNFGAANPLGGKVRRMALTYKKKHEAVG